MNVTDLSAGESQFTIEAGAWLALRRSQPELTALTAEELLQRTQQEPVVPLRYGKGAQGVVLIAECPLQPQDEPPWEDVVEQGDPREIAQRTLQHWLQGVSEPCISLDIEAVETVLGEAASEWTRRDEDWIVPAGAPSPVELRITRVPRGLRVEGVLGCEDAYDSFTRRALAEFLCRVQLALRFARVEFHEQVCVVAEIGARSIHGNFRHGLGSVGTGLRLANAVQALRVISLDPWLQAQVKLADGRKLTAIEIQQEYLAECEHFAARHELPAWGGGVLHCWREVLTGLARNPLELATRLDGYVKLLMLDHAIRRAGISWNQVRDALRLVDELRQAAPHPGLIRALVSEEHNSVPKAHRVAFESLRRQVHSAGRGALDRVRFALRLQVLDFKYHELGGVYDSLAQDGRMDGVVVNSADIQRAVVEAPPGRAAARGSLVRKYRGDAGWVANWDMVLHCSNETGFDLSDPFAAEAKLAGGSKLAEFADSPLSQRSLLRRLISF